MDPWPYPPSLTLCLGLAVVILPLRSASQPFAGSSMVVVCWLDLGVSCIQAGMEGLIRSNGLWQAACTS